MYSRFSFHKFGFTFSVTSHSIGSVGNMFSSLSDLGKIGLVIRIATKQLSASLHMEYFRFNGCHLGSTKSTPGTQIYFSWMYYLTLSYGAPYLAPWPSKTIKRLYMYILNKQRSTCEFLFVVFHVSLLQCARVCAFVCVFFRIRMYAFMYGSQQATLTRRM